MKNDILVIDRTRKLVSMAFPQAVPNGVSVNPTCRYISGNDAAEVRVKNTT